jgi:hypothetical protein
VVAWYFNIIVMIFRSRASWRLALVVVVIITAMITWGSTGLGNYMYYKSLAGDVTVSTSSELSGRDTASVISATNPMLLRTP